MSFCYRSSMLKNLAPCLFVVLLLVSPSPAKDRYQQPRPVQLDHDGHLDVCVSMHPFGTTMSASGKAFGAAGKLDYAEGVGRITAREARALGVQWNFFPVSDVNSNLANPFFNTRSFAEDPKQVRDL